MNLAAMEGLLVLVSMAAIAGPFILIAGLVRRSRSRRRDLIEHPPLPPAKIADGRPINSPRGRASEGYGTIGCGVVLTALLIGIGFLVYVVAASFEGWF